MKVQAVCQMVIDNVKQVLYHLPSFLIGFMLAPFAKTGKKISYFWMSILPLALVAIMKVMQCGILAGIFGVTFRCGMLSDF